MWTILFDDDDREAWVGDHKAARRNKSATKEVISKALMTIRRCENDKCLWDDMFLVDFMIDKMIYYVFLIFDKQLFS